MRSTAKSCVITRTQEAKRRHTIACRVLATALTIDRNIRREDVLIARGLKAKKTTLERHGSDFYRRIGAKGGRNGHTGGFATNRELAVIAGRKGGRISSRKGVKNGQRKERTYQPVWGE